MKSHLISVSLTFVKRMHLFMRRIILRNVFVGVGHQRKLLGNFRAQGPLLHTGSWLRRLAAVLLPNTAARRRSHKKEAQITNEFHLQIVCICVTSSSSEIPTKEP